MIKTYNILFIFLIVFYFNERNKILLINDLNPRNKITIEIWINKQ